MSHLAHWTKTASTSAKFYALYYAPAFLTLLALTAVHKVMLAHLAPGAICADKITYRRTFRRYAFK